MEAQVGALDDDNIFSVLRERGSCPAAVIFDLVRDAMFVNK